MIDRSLIIFGLVALTLAAFGAVALSSDISADESAESPDGLTQIPVVTEFPDTEGFKPEYSLEALKSFVSGIVASAIDLVENEEDEDGETIRIDSTIEVTEETGPYNIGKANDYVFTGNGSIAVKEGGTLRFGNDFTIEGDPAVIKLCKGSYVKIFGCSITIPVDINLELRGTMSLSMDLISQLHPLTLDAQLKGGFHFDGTIKAGPISINPDRDVALEFDIALKVILNPDSRIDDVRDIPEHIFEEDNGVVVILNVNNLKAGFDTTLCDIDVDVAGVQVQISSPISFCSLDVDDLDIDRIMAKADFKYSVMDTIDLEVEKVHADRSYVPVRYNVSKAEFRVESISQTVFKSSIWMGLLSFELGDRFHVSMFSGYMSLAGDVDMDLDVEDSAECDFSSTFFNGRLRIEKEDAFNGTLNMRYRTNNSLIIGDDVNIVFAGDEHAYINIMSVIGYIVHIQPDEGYKLLEMTSERYVGYTIDEYAGYATPESLVGIYHVELGERIYHLYLEEEVREVRPTEIVTLPIPEPREGYTYMGWTDWGSLYTETFEMPAYDAFLKIVWSDDGYQTKIESGIYTITTENDSILLKEDVVKKVKAMMDDGSVHTLRIILSSARIDMHRGTVSVFSGDVMVNVTQTFGSQFPQYMRMIGDRSVTYLQVFNNGDLLDEFEEEISLTATYEVLIYKNNAAKAYYINELSRLEEMECDYEFYTYYDEEMESDKRVAEVTMKTSHPPFCIVETLHEKEHGSLKPVLIYSMIPVILTGLILAFITRRR